MCVSHVVYPIQCGETNLIFLQAASKLVSTFPCTYLGLPRRHLLRQPLQKTPGAGSLYIDPTGKFNFEFLFMLGQFLISSIIQGPQDIDPDSSTNSTEIGDDIPRSEEPPSLGAPKSNFQAPEPPSLSGTKGSPNPTKTPSPQKAPPNKANASSNPFETPLSPEPIESPQDHSEPSVSWT
jgi:hypothetical protein